MSDSSVVLTASRRLARLRREEVARRLVQEGLKAWESPPIHPLQSWILEVTAQEDEDPPLLTSFASRALWFELARQDGGGDPTSLATLLIEAWRLVMLYGIPRQELVAAAAEETQRFVRLASRYEETLLRLGYEDETQRLSRAAERIARRGRPAGVSVVHKVGFVDLPPLLASVFTALADAGVEVREESLGDRLVAPRLVVAPTEEDEWRLAACWARPLLERDPEALIALVIPELDKHRERIARVVGEHLDPQAVLYPERTRRAYNLAGGHPLFDEPVVRAARLIARLHLVGLSAVEVGALLLSPYWGRGLGESRWRDELALRALTADRRVWLEDVPEGLLDPSGDLARYVKEPPGPRVRDQDRTLGDWIAWFERTLHRWGCPGPRLDSPAHQAWHAHTELLLDLRSCTPVVPRLLGADAFLHLYEEALRSQLFQPEIRGARFLVLEPRDVPGLRLEALWVAGLHAGAWPRPVALNPFIPGEIARRHGLPRADVPSTLVEARALESAWRRSVPRLVYSYALREESLDRRASPLLAGLERLELAPPAMTERGLRGRLYGDRGSYVWQEVPASDPVPYSSSRRLERGVRILEATAQCPFWGWAERLRSEPLRPYASPLDPRLHGSLLHEALERLAREEGGWDQGTKSRLEPRLPRIAETVVLSHRDDPTFTPGLRTLEILRLVRLLRAWLELEARVPGKRSWETEVPVRYLDKSTGIELWLRTDRVDRDADGNAVVIDYKTVQGDPRGRHRPDGEEPIPQIWLYALAHERVVAAGYLVFSGFGRQTGVAEAHLVGRAGTLWSSDSSPLVYATVNDWPRWLEDRRSRLASLFQDVRAGRSDLAPREGDKTCDRCPHAFLCRKSSLLLSPVFLGAET